MSDLKDLSAGDLRITPLAVGINLQLEDSDTNLLASPRIRARDREKARILIGDKVPVITNTVTPVASGSSVVTGQVQYLDVGIKLEVEPRVYLEGDIGIKLNLEVSNIVKQIGDGSANSTLAYQIGTRSASTTLRLRDGETQVLGGLISDLDRTTAAKVPGLWHLPVLGRIFRNDSGTNTKSEIVLSITPRIVRGPGVAEGRYRDVFSGTDAAVRDTPLRLDPVGAAGGVIPGSTMPTTAAPPSAAPRPMAPTSATRATDGRAPTGTLPPASETGSAAVGQPQENRSRTARAPRTSPRRPRVRLRQHRQGPAPAAAAVIPTRRLRVKRRRRHCPGKQRPPQSRRRRIERQRPRRRRQARLRPPPRRMARLRPSWSHGRARSA